MAQYDRGPILSFAQPLDFGSANAYAQYTAEATQRYMLGTRYITWDGSVYKYALAKGTLDPDMGVKCAATQNLAYVTFGAAQGASAGATSIKCTFANTDGYANSGLVLENELAGGSCVIFSDTVATMRRGILGNTGVVAGGGEVTLYLDAPIQVAITAATSFIEAIASPYYGVAHDSETKHSVIGVPCAIATTGQYCWLQTWGVSWVTPQSRVGASSLIRAVYWRHDGSLDIRSLNGTFVDAYITDQYAGFVLQNTQAEAQAAPFVMLQVSI